MSNRTVKYTTAKSPCARVEIFCRRRKVIHAATREALASPLYCSTRRALPAAAENPRPRAHGRFPVVY